MARLFFIGNAHLDPVWLWRWPEGLAEVKATFRSALDRLAEFDDFIFTCSSAAYYAWVEENEPAMFEEIRRRVAEGRWVIVGGFWIQPDCNIPCGESFVRQGLYAQRYFLEKFGRAARVGYNPDSFGHGGGLPQILRGCGLEAYVFQRPGDQEKDMPDLFLWEGVDGTRIPAYRISFGYGNPEPLDSAEPLRRKAAAIAARGAATGVDQMVFYGVGNHGGGPTVRNISCIRDLIRDHPGREALFASPDDYFASVRPGLDHAPVVRGDLQHHASGCYSAMGEIKSLNRRAELRLLAAEKVSTVAGTLFDLEFPTKTIETAWKRVLFNQFHDILGGCCIPEAYEDARESFGFALSLAAEVANAGMQRISWHIDTSRDVPAGGGKEDWMSWEQGDRGQPFVVFNPLSWDVRGPIRLERMVAAVEDDEGRALAIQPLRASRTNGEDKWDSLFLGMVPAMGYRVFWAYGRKATPVQAPSSVRACGTILENEYLRVSVDPGTGCVGELFDKRLHSALLEGGRAAFQVIDETDSDTWAHGIFSFNHVVGIFAPASITVLENGPVRAVLRAKCSWGASTLVCDYVLYDGSRELGLDITVDWHEKHRMLKIAVPVEVAKPVFTCGISYGTIVKPCGGIEEPAGMWADISGCCPDGRTAGIALLNTGKYSYDADGATLRLTALRSPIYADHFGARDGHGLYMDQGESSFRIALVPHAGDWRAAAPEQRAYELNCTFPVIPETYHNGPLPRSMSAVRVDAPDVIVEALKAGEDGTGYVLRCFEAGGIQTAARIELGFLHRSFDACFRPGEVKTFLIPRTSDEPILETDLLERPFKQPDRPQPAGSVPETAPCTGPARLRASPGKASMPARAPTMATMRPVSLVSLTALPTVVSGVTGAADGDIAGCPGHRGFTQKRFHRCV